MRKEKNIYNATKVIFWSPKLVMRYYGRKQQNVIDHGLRTQRSFLMDGEKGTSVNSSEAFFCYLKLNHEIMI
jgi:hypothetical protein